MSHEDTRKSEEIAKGYTMLLCLGTLASGLERDTSHWASIGMEVT